MISKTRHQAKNQHKSDEKAQARENKRTGEKGTKRVHRNQREAEKKPGCERAPEGSRGLPEGHRPSACPEGGAHLTSLLSSPHSSTLNFMPSFSK